MRTNAKYSIIAGALILWVVVTPFMWRDLRRRSYDGVRGPKWLWWIASANLTGSMAYWLFGRKEAPEKVSVVESV
ncbi:MAG TPA: hypothetical protein VII65_04665 [Acidimicrobiales bacterium]